MMMSRRLLNLQRLLQVCKGIPMSLRLGRFRLILECLEDRQLLASGYVQVNLASDVPGLARFLDANMINPWGLSFSPTGPFWFADNGAGVSDVLDGRGQALPLVVALPVTTRGTDGPTGTVFNGG